MIGPRRVTSSYPYPAPSEPEYSELEYDLDRAKWARGLTEGNLRSLASDYLRGDGSEACEDAYKEFKRREAAGLLSDSERMERPLKGHKNAAKSRAHHRSSK